MTSPDEKLSPQEVLEEIRATRTSLDLLPERLKAVEDRGNKLVWAVIGVCIIIVITAMFFLWNENRNNSKQNDKFDNFAFCQADYNRVNTSVQQTRAELASKLNQAQARRDRNIAKVTAGGGGNINDIFNKYAEELAAVEAARANTPIPAYPECYDKYITHDFDDPDVNEK